jgi:hypothetical protein
MPPVGANWDDHDPQNVVPWVTALGNSLPGGIPPLGLNSAQMKLMIDNWLADPNVNLSGHYTVTIVDAPVFDRIKSEIEVSQDVLLLLGFWQDTTGAGDWCRMGGHWVTVAGVDPTPNAQQISFSDPFTDNAHAGGAGVVWDGWLLAHPMPPHGVGVHNDAGNESHDWYPVQASGSPGGGISPESYGYEFTTDNWMNFGGLNFEPRLESYRRNWHPGIPIHTEVEEALIICPNFDYGDLHYDYPTIDIESCGPAHPLTDKVWLGAQIDSEIQPHIDVPNSSYDMDNCDDGVQFLNLPWTPGTQVSVTVTFTTGNSYAGEAPYLNAWKDGNIDGDFDDGPNNPAYTPPEDDWLQCSEWVLHDLVCDPNTIVGGTAQYTFVFCDPGVDDLGRYDLRMRFRVTSQAVGRYGYGGYWGGGVSNGRGTYDIDWVLGEVEDYIFDDQQLAVELMNFDAVSGDGIVTLNWTTASETNNHHFEIMREGILIGEVSGAGTSATENRYTWNDEHVVNGTSYSYTLIAVDESGASEEIALAEATPLRSAGNVSRYALYQNYPNPFNSLTSITFDLAEDNFVSLKVYNLMGQEIKTLVAGELSAGRREVVFDAADLATGIYFYRLESGSFTSQRKLVLIK